MALNSVPPVTLPPCISLSFTGFQIRAPDGGLNAGPYFQVAGSKAPWLTAPAGATFLALLSVPAGAASGNCVVPAAALFAYGSAVGCGGVCVFCARVARATVMNTAHTAVAGTRYLT